MPRKQVSAYTKLSETEMSFAVKVLQVSPDGCLHSLTSVALAAVDSYRQAVTNKMSGVHEKVSDRSVGSSNW